MNFLLEQDVDLSHTMEMNPPPAPDDVNQLDNVSNRSVLSVLLCVIIY